jgi:hypothetical protein
MFADFCLAGYRGERARSGLDACGPLDARHRLGSDARLNAPAWMARARLASACWEQSFFWWETCNLDRLENLVPSAGLATA